MDGSVHGGHIRTLWHKIGVSCIVARDISGIGERRERSSLRDQRDRNRRNQRTRSDVNPKPVDALKRSAEQ